MKLSQSRGFLRIDSEILPDGIFYRERGLLSSHESKIPFDHIANEYFIRTFHVPQLYFFIIFFFSSRALVGYRVIPFPQHQHHYRFRPSCGREFYSCIFALGTWMQSPHYIGYLTSRGGLFLFRHKGRGRPERLPGANPGKTRSDIFASNKGERTEMQPEEKKGGPGPSFH